MPTFGAHETGERLFLSGVGGIYALKVDATRVIKELQPPVGIWSDERLEEEIDAFRLRAKTQRAIAKASKFWAPVYEIAAIRQGTEALSGGGEVIEHPSSIGNPYAQRPVASGAFLIMDRYERSVQSLIDGRVNLLNADLRCLMTAVMKGLLDFSKENGCGVGGRAHGALKAANILLKNSADLTTATVHLVDPAPDGALEKNSRDQDLGNLARIIYELVNHRPYEEGTIARSRDWDAIGPNGEDWRELCIALLNPHAPAAERDLEKLLPVIDTWRRKPKKSKKPMLLAAAAVLVIVGSVVAWELSHPKVVYDAGRWEALNLEYHAWFGDFVKPLYVPKNMAQFQRVNYPHDIVTIFDKYKDFVRFDPEQIDNGDVKVWTDRITHANGDNPLARAGDNPKYTQDGLLLVNEVTNALSPEKWPLMKSLSDAADRFEKERPWQKPAAGIRKVMAEAQPPRVLDGKLPVEDAVKAYAKIPLTERIKKSEELRQERPKSIFEGIEAAVTTGSAVSRVETHLGRMVDKVNGLPGTAGQDKAGQIGLLAGLKKFVTDYPAGQATEDVASLEAPLNQVDGLLDQLVAAFPAGRQVDFDELLADPAAKLSPSVENYTTFAKATENYWNITKDPRDAAAWGQKMGTINEMIGLIKDSAAPDDKLLPGINQEYARLGSLIQSTQGLKPILKNEKAIGDNAAAIATALERLESSANEHPAYMNQSKFDAYVLLQKSRATDPAKLPATMGSVAPPVKAKWLEAQNALVTVVSKRSLAEFRKTHVADERKFGDVEAFYAELNRTIPENDAARVNLEKAFATGPEWAKALALRVAAESRVDGLAELLKNAVKDAANPPAANDATYVSLRQQSLKSYEATCVETQTLISDHLTMDARLDELKIDKNEGWRKLYEMWPDGKNGLLTEAPIKAIRTRVGTLVTTEGLADYAKVREASLSDVPEISLAGWRLMGGVAIDESKPYLADEVSAEKKLGGHLAKLKDAGQSQAIAAEVGKAQPARWQRWADVAASAESIATALTEAPAFHVEIAKQGQPVMFYYQELLKLKAEFAKSPREADLKGPAQAFVKLMDDPALSGVAKSDAVSSMLKDMTKSMSTDQETSVSGKQGPQFADWDMETPNQDVRIFHSKDKKSTLEFRRMQVIEESLTSKPQKTIFLCTTEMSAGVFVQAMNSMGKLDDLDNSKAAAAHWFELPATSYYKSGPRSWMITGSDFAVSSRWLDETGDPLTNGKPFYPTGAAPADPTTDSPVELVTPWVAMYAARLLGCRLPTSDEWQLAYTTFELPKAGTPLPKDVWNLRGDGLPGGKASWSTQQAYADGYPERLMPYPDSGIYSFLSKPAAKGTAAKPWMAADLAKLAPERITTGIGPYAHSTLWFEPVDKEIVPSGSAGANGVVMHHLVGNVAEFVFDSDEVAAPILNNTATPTLIDDSVRKARNKIFVIGGSSLSPPEIPFNEKQVVNPDSVPAKRGYSDVGFRLAYTAPKETIVEVLAKAFRDPTKLPGPRTK